VASILAQVAPPPPSGIWYPTILGILVVAVAIMLFMGSIYALLATNLGARLGFLAVFTALMGFMVLLTTLWMFTASPLNTLKGTPPAWKLETIVKSLDEPSVPPAVRTAATTGRKVPVASQSDLKAVVDANLVIQQPIANIPAKPGANKYAQFQLVTDYTTTNYYEVGGSNPHLVDWQITHQPLYAVVQFCAVPPSNLPFGVPPPPPTCDNTSPKNGFAILTRDFGSLRIPPFVTFVISVILFSLGLLALHWREKDEQAAAAAAAAVADKIPAETRTPAPVGS
jgi:hypothetical protein